MRQRLSLDRSWQFALGHATNPARDFEFIRDRSLVKAGEARGAAGPKFDDSKWRTIDLPHDWAIELPIVKPPHAGANADSREGWDHREHVEHGCFAIGPRFPENSVGWYRRTFEISKRDLGRRISVEFDGVFRDSIVWINGHRLGRHASGYAPVRYDLTDFLNYGDKNVLAVRVDASCYEGWWYEGAGIYRHVWLVKTAAVHVAPWGTFVTSELRKDRATLIVRTTIVNESDDAVGIELVSEIRGVGASPTRRNKNVGEAPTPHKKQLKLSPWSEIEVSQSVPVGRPRLWSCDEPNLYQLRTTLTSGARMFDSYDTTFGIRTFRWDAKRGFFLNGKRLKIKGMCCHRDHAGVGAALPDRLHELRMEKLKELGCNAFRASHYPHAPELLDACDRLGLLVMAENRLAGSSPEVLSQLETLVRRDRNHPSVFLWSLANEEHTVQWKIAGERIGRTMVRLCHQLDPTRKVTTAMHDKGLGVGFANIVDVHGWNYMKVGDIDAYHRKHPNRPIIGSEEASTVCTRGIYADDPKRGYVRAYDERAPGWGSTAENWWNFFAARDWLAGAFVWTGFDYRGEPIPYQWPCTASHFGVMDLCGFPKDNYYYYKSWWSDEPVLHLFPHWNWRGREGEEIDVRCFTNCDEVELFLNHRSLGRKSVEKNSHVAWKVRFEPGRLEAIGNCGEGASPSHLRLKPQKRGRGAHATIVTATRETAGPPRKLVLAPDREAIRADGADVSSITVSVVDALGRPVPTAINLICFNVIGAGRLLGVGNGDPSSHESDKAPQRKLFNGLALALIQSSQKRGLIRVSAVSSGLAAGHCEIRCR